MRPTAERPLRARDAGKLATACGSRDLPASGRHAARAGRADGGAVFGSPPALRPGAGGVLRCRHGSPFSHRQMWPARVSKCPRHEATGEST
jgi:hypothetical protein